MVARGEEPLPILFVTQVVGLAVGLTPESLGLERHFVDTEPLIARLVEQAAARDAEERRVRQEAAAERAARQKAGAAAAGPDGASPKDGEAQ